jgi:hypothetical protein
VPPIRSAPRPSRVYGRGPNQRARREAQKPSFSAVDGEMAVLGEADTGKHAATLRA